MIMSRHSFTRIAAPLLLFSGLIFEGVTPAFGQANASVLIAQIAKAFAPTQTVLSVKLDGSVIWHSGSSSDSGPITMLTSSDGSQSFMAHLASNGNRSEEQSGIGSGMSCQWARADGTAHTKDMMSCQKPVPWVLPALALQNAKLPKSAGYTDLGNATLEGIAYRHLQGQLVLSDVPAKLLSQSIAASTIDAYVDPETFDLAVVRYQVHPDDNPALNIQVEIRYGQITNINGVRIPFLIQRYINGTLQLEITIASAQIS